MRTTEQVISMLRAAAATTKAPEEFRAAARRRLLALLAHPEPETSARQCVGADLDPPRESGHEPTMPD